MYLTFTWLCLVFTCVAGKIYVATLFPRGQTAVYKFRSDVTTGTTGEASYASGFSLEGKLFVKHDTGDPYHENAFYAALSDVKTGTYNGKITDDQSANVLTPINETDIVEPFLIVYSTYSTLWGVKIAANESKWSRYIKMSIASTLQLELVPISFDDRKNHQTFLSQEPQIYGSCMVNYDAYAKNPNNATDNVMVVEKFFAAQETCSKYYVDHFDHVDSEGCQAHKEELPKVASNARYELVKESDHIVIQKLEAHERIEYLPLNAKFEAHYARTNVSFSLEKLVPNEDIILPPMNFKDVPLTRDLSYKKPQGRYADNSAIDLTEGRHDVDLNMTMSELHVTLGEAADYLQENHMDMKAPDWKHGQTINRILQTMSYMDDQSLEEVFSVYENPVTIKEDSIKQIFLEVLPQVGTPASVIVALNIIRLRKVSNSYALVMLAKLPLNVRSPSAQLLSDVENLMQIDTMSVEVRKAAILSFASLVGRTYKNRRTEDIAFPLYPYLHSVFQHVENETDYGMKIVYLMALKNAQVPTISSLLAPIIRGERKISEHPEHLRLLAIWAIDEAVRDNYHEAVEVLWPVMADTSLSTKLRIAAYEILMNRVPTITHARRIQSFMMREKNEHLYNYHYTTLMGIANSVDPCRHDIREHARTVIRSTRIRGPPRTILSSAFSYDYTDETDNHAETFAMGMIVSEATGTPEVLKFEHTITDHFKPAKNSGVYLHVEGIEKLITMVIPLRPGPSWRHHIVDVLRKAAKNMPAWEEFHMDVVVQYKGRTVIVSHYDQQSVLELLMNFSTESILGMLLKDSPSPIYKDPTMGTKHDVLGLNFQHILYDDLYERVVTSSLGLPVVLASRVPLLASMKVDCRSTADDASLAFDGMIWRHGDTSLSIYNPMSDSWHAIRRSTATDMRIPFKMNITWDRGTLKISFPQHPADPWIGGVRIRTNDFVTINENGGAAVKVSCVTCRRHEDVDSGTSRMKRYEKEFDSLGLQHTVSMMTCNNRFTALSFGLEWYKIFMSGNKNDWNDWTLRAALTTRQQMKNIFITAGSCGTLLKIETRKDPSISRIESIRNSFFEYNINLIETSSNKSARSWEIAPRYSFSTWPPALMVTRKTPGETNLKICVSANPGTWSTLRSENAISDGSGVESKSVLAIDIGRTDGDDCPRNDTRLEVTVKSEMSDARKREIDQHVGNSACRRDFDNPLYANPKNLIPKTANCLNEFLRNTTFTKYTMHVFHQKIPEEVQLQIRSIEEILLSELLAHKKWTNVRGNSGNIEITSTFSMPKKSVNISVVTPTRSYDLVDIGLERPRFEGFGTLPNPVWYYPLENSVYPTQLMMAYVKNEIKICSIYPKTVLTGDGRNIPFNLTDQWTLVSGEHAFDTFAIFAKMIGNNMAVRIFFYDSLLDIVPSVDNDAQLFNGEEPVPLRTGTMKPVTGINVPNLLALRSKDHIVMISNGMLPTTIPLIVVHGGNHVALAVDRKFQGRLSGLCGHLDGTYPTEIPEIYTMPNFKARPY